MILLDVKIGYLITQLSNEKVFYGTVSNINKDNDDYFVNVDLFNETTNLLDDIIVNESISNFTYSFELLIETVNLSILNFNKDILRFEIVDEKHLSHNIFDGYIWLNINKRFDKLNSFNNKKMRFKVERLTQEYKNNYLELINKHKQNLQKHWIIKKRLKINVLDEHEKKNPVVYYRQYHVGGGNTSYINVDGVTRGFFNIGFSGFIKGKSFPYYGFANHKPDWVIISNLNINNYRAAIRYGNSDILGCDWILPYMNELNINIIRLFYGILNSGGKIYLIKYIANSSVVSLAVDNVKMELYFTSEIDMNESGLSLYLEKDDKFISLGNSDYNFLTKLLIPQKFDILVLPSDKSNIKTKVSIKKTGGYRVYRIDNKGTFKCTL